MLLFLFGKDTYRSRQKLGEILKRYETLPKEQRNLQVLDCTETSFEDVQKELRTSSLFVEKKFLVLKNVFHNKDVADALFKQKETLQKSADTLLFFEEGVLRPFDKAQGRQAQDPHPLFSFLKENAKSQEFKPLTRANTLAWAEKEFQKYGKTIEKDALFFLIGETGNNLWRLSQEILKLVAFLGTRTVVKVQDVKNLLHLSLEYEERGNVLEFVSFHIKKGEEPLYILSIIATQLRNSSRAKLEQSFEKIFETDKNIKTGRMGPVSALYFFAAGA